MAYTQDTSEVCEILDSVAEAALVSGPVKCENPECEEDHYRAVLTSEHVKIIRLYVARYLRVLRQIPCRLGRSENPMEMLMAAMGQGNSSSLLDLLIALIEADAPGYNPLSLSNLSQALSNAVNSHAEKFKAISFAKEMTALSLLEESPK
jgi:hypothetical protein